MTLKELGDFLKKDKRNDESVIDNLISQAEENLACEFKKLEQMKSFIKLDSDHQQSANATYEQENVILTIIDGLEVLHGRNLWFSIGRTNIELGFMALRKGVTEVYKAKVNQGKQDD